MSNVELGCGLLAIGREWGTTPRVPSETEALTFLETAYQSGIRFFDTAASYGVSERRLGKFLETLSDTERAEVIVATKFGEHWDDAAGSPYADYSYEGLKRSVDNSIALLGKISILQLHRATAELLEDTDVQAAFDYAAGLRIEQFGVSANNPETIQAALDDERYGAIQMPYSQSHTTLGQFLLPVQQGGKFSLVNRPLDMGKIATRSGEAAERHTNLVNAYGFILEKDFEGIVLSGTSNPDHLQENISAFNEAVALASR